MKTHIFYLYLFYLVPFTFSLSKIWFNTVHMDTADLVPAARREEIMRRAHLERVIRVKDLAELLSVHEMTIRRDLDALVDEGRLERVHGGARLKNQGGIEVAYDARAATNQGAKARIARAAADLISEGDTVAFDASTTALEVQRRLRLTSGLAVVTSLDGANTLASAGVPFVMIGGSFHAPARSFVGRGVCAQLARLHPDKVFFSAKGFSVQAGFTDAHLPEVEVKECLIASAGLKIALLDSSKFGKEALGTIVGTESVDVLITDCEPSEEVRERLEHDEVQLIVAQ